MYKACCAISVFVLLLVGSGCQGTKSHAVEGGVIGGIIGAAAGGIIGHQSHSAAQGAAIGAATGAIAGSVVGAQMPKANEAGQAPAPAAAGASQMSTQEIVDMTRQGVNEAVIIDKIRLSNSRFTLTAADIDYLKQQGVSQRVIDAMQGL